MRKWLPNLAWYLVLFLGMAGSWRVMQHTVDPDYWWRLRHGYEVLRYGFVSGDPYSYTMPSFPFVSHAWSMDVFFAWIHSIGGYAWLSAAVAAVVGLTFAVVTRRYAHQWLGVCALLCLWGAGLAMMGVRAQVLAWPLFFGALWLYFLPEARWQFWRWTIPIFALVWANMHGSVPILFLFLGLRVAISWWESKKFPVLDAMLLLVSLVVTLLNPAGIGLWREIVLTNTDPSLSSSISEWVPSWKKSTSVFLLMVGLTSLALGLAYLRHHWRSLVVVVIVLVLGLLSFRHVPLTVFTSLVVALKLFPQTALAVLWQKSDVVLKRFLLAGATVAVGVLVWISVTEVFFRAASYYPEEAVTIITRQYPQAVVFNYYDWGGYLIWARPEARVFIDGRMPSWRWQPPAGELAWAHKEWRQVRDGDRETFLQLVDQLDIDTVLWKKIAPPDNAFLTVLDELGWGLVYDDGRAVVYRKP